MNLRTVELIQAFCWTCDDCGRDNFERTITLDPASIRPDQIAANMDPDEYREFIELGYEAVWTVAPPRVRCGHCGAEFQTEEPS